MKVIQMNKKDQMISECNTWLVDGGYVYAAIDGNVNTDIVEPYDLSPIFMGSKVNEEELVQYLTTVGFPWSSNFI